MVAGARCGWALAVDVLGGEPPAALHPTVWMGRWICSARDAHRGRRSGPAASLLAGAAVVGTGALVTAIAAATIEPALRQAPRPARGVIGGALLKPALSLRALVAAGGEVEDALRRAALPEARRLLAWHLVSRDTSRLSAADVAGAAIESLAENLGDGFVGPLLAHAAGGLPAAYVYRFVNTADAMLGYRTPELEWFGKTAARADDAFNLLPSRITALLIALAAPVAGGSTRRSLAVAFADGRRTPSPNAGWPMAAMAGALDVRLDKRLDSSPTGVPRRAARPLYVLNSAGRPPAASDLARALRVVGAAAVIAVAMDGMVRYASRRRDSERGRAAHRDRWTA